MTIEEVKEGDYLKLKVTGKIDNFSHEEFQNAILMAFHREKKVVIDLEEVDYVSSVGLRALLLGEKTASAKGGSMTIINAGQSVMDVFEVTGFDTILDIRRL